MSAELLSDAEKRAMDLTVELTRTFCTQIVGDGPTREADIGEFVAHVHNIQATIMAQAAARAYPSEYRLLGSLIPNVVGFIAGAVVESETIK